MAIVADELITAEAFMNMPDPIDGSRQELVKGVIETMPPPGFDHGECQVTVSALLHQFIKSNRLGRIVVETGVKTEEEPDTIRGPDISFWSVGRLPLDQRVIGYPKVAPELCVEIVSPSNSRKELRAKANEYLFANVRMVWIVDPDEKTVEIIRDPEESRTLSESKTLSGEDVLPGFACKVAELFG